MIVFPFPPSILSAHATTGGHYRKIAATKKWRALAKEIAQEAGPHEVPAIGDIRLHIRFVPPDRRSDRVNMPNRVKPLIDGIADALGVNDVRFLPSYEFADPEKPGRVEVTFG